MNIQSIWNHKRTPVVLSFASGVLLGGVSWYSISHANVLPAAVHEDDMTVVSKEYLPAPGLASESIGNTPLFYISSLSKATGCNIYGKAEYLNPSGSVKDRVAKYLIESGERKYPLTFAPGESDESTPKPTIVEGTGGNTGIGLALLANERGYQTCLTMPSYISTEKIELMQIMGAQVHVQPCVPFSDAEHYYHKAGALAKTIPRSYYPDQFENTVNEQAHYETTGPEIWAQLKGRIHGFVCASGTGGTIAGCSTYLKERNPDIQCYLVDPEGGATARYIESNKTNSEWKYGKEFIPRAPGSSIAEGIGLDRVTENFRLAKIDGAFLSTDQEMIQMAYHLLRKDGIFIGPSAAVNVVGAVKLAQKLGPGHTIVTILCDSGERYRSKLFNLDWMKEQKLDQWIS